MPFSALDRGRQRLARLLEGHFDGAKSAGKETEVRRRKPWETAEEARSAVADAARGRRPAVGAKPWEREEKPPAPRGESPAPRAAAASQQRSGSAEEGDPARRSDSLRARVAAVDARPRDGERRGAADGAGPPHRAVLPRPAERPAATPRAEARPEPRRAEASAALALRAAEVETAAALRMDELRAGDVVGGLCEIEGLLGRSRCYSVYRARHLVWDLGVAVKVPRADCAGADALRAGFAAAVERWMGLGMHPNVAFCFYTQVVDAVPLAVVESVPGGNLQPWITSGRARNLRVGLSLGLQVCHGLEWAHEAHVWHGALKPENCLIGAQGDVAISDFGIAGRTATAIAEGSERSEAYVAPECWVEPARLDARVDIFSLGVLLYELLVGIRPYEMTRGPRRSAAAPLAASGALPEVLATLLRRCVEWEPGKRPQSVADVRTQLAAVYRGLFNKESPFAAPPRGSWEADGWNNRAVAAQLLGRESDAEVAWENALAADSKHLATTYNYGVARWRRGALPDTSVMRQLEQTGARAADLLPLLAAVHCERGDRAAARSLLPDEDAERIPGPLRELLHGDGAAAAAGPRREWDGYAAYLTAVALSSEGDLLCFGCDEGGLYSARTDVVESPRELPGHGASVSSLSLGSSGRTAVSAGDDGAVRVWDVATRRCVREVPASGKILAVAFNEPRSLLALACSDAENFAGVDGAQLVVWDLERERLLVQLKGHTNTCKAVAISADGNSVVSGSDDLTIRVWDLEHGGQCRRVLEGNQHFIADVAVNADGNVVVSGGWDKSVRVWNLASGSAQVLWGHLGIVNAVAVSADGRTVVSGGWDRTVRIWDVETGRCLRTIDAHSGIVSAVAVSADGLTAASVGWDKAARVWSIPARWEKVCAPLLVRRRPYAVLPTGEPEPDELCDLGEEALREGRVDEALELLRRARQGDEVPARAADLWRALGRLCRRTEVTALRPTATLRCTGSAGCATFANCGRWLVDGGLDGVLTVWNVGLERRERRLDGHRGRVVCVAASEDGATLLSGGVDRTVRIWEPDTGRCLKVLEGHSSVVAAIDVSADGRWVLSGGYDHQVRLWDTAAGRCVAVRDGHRRQVSAVALDAARDRFASGDHSGAILVAPLRAATPPLALVGHAARITGLRFGGDGRRLLSGDASGALRLWDLPSGECLGSLSGLQSGVVWLDFRCEAEWAAAVASDGNIVFWDTANRRATATAKLREGATASAALTADGDTLLMLGVDGSAALWEIDWDLSPP